ncbi:MAG: wax ester/triacylglycerol synthase family O-acyltransferase [Ardenticatenaceae bacterium]|nr:wax ester/triacylglycerol synthase family O-acyltransferase [Ardenticatenaceae bacterium]MCB8988448.1 wax ester/triacylglycerol synthase family O-acyltransferase [Ardenticatenaceae bacterium]
MSPKTEPLSTADAVWLHMEDPTNLMFVVGVLLFDQPLDIDTLRSTLAARLLRFDRFRQRLKKSRRPLRRLQWQPDPHFDINAHVHSLALPAPGDEAALQRLIGDFASTPLDMSKPLWQVHLIEGVNGRGSAAVVRIHHAIADGLALIYVLLSVLDEEPDAAWVAEMPADEDGSFLAQLWQPAASALHTTRKLTGTAVAQSRDYLTHPGKMIATAKTAGGLAFASARLLRLGPDAETVLRGPLGIAKRVAWSMPIPLSVVKLIGKSSGATVNDVLLTTFTGTLRRYLAARGEAVDDLEIRVLVPVALRPLAESAKLGNHFGSVILALPVHVADPWERLQILKARMAALKQSPEATIMLTSMSLVGYAPGDLAGRLIELFSKSCSAIMTNVPGPQYPLYLNGVPLQNVMVWGPLSGRLGVSSSILSYNGRVTLGIISDANLVPDPDALVAAFGQEFAALQDRIANL